jgi:thioredoxin-like negative regulator of GroEL
MGWLRDLFKGKDRVQPLSVSDENFRDEVLGSDLPVLLDVWTPTCTHCQKLVPVVMDIARDYEGRLKVAEVNGAEAPRTMAALQVRGTPTVVYFHSGREVERVVGFRGSVYHRDLIDNELLPLVRGEDTEAPAGAS